MGLPKSSIDVHPQRTQIIEDLLADKSLRDVSDRTVPRVPVMVLSRYRAALRKGQPIDMQVHNESTSKQWCERELVSIVCQSTSGKRRERDLPTARGAIMDIARLNGWIAPARSESLSLNLHAIGNGAIAHQLRAALHALPPADRAALKADPDLSDLD